MKYPSPAFAAGISLLGLCNVAAFAAEAVPAISTPAPATAQDASAVETRSFPISPTVLALLLGPKGASAGDASVGEQLGLFFVRAGALTASTEVTYENQKISVTGTPAELDKLANLLRRYEAVRPMEIPTDQSAYARNGVLHELGNRWAVIELDGKATGAAPPPASGLIAAPTEEPWGEAVDGVQIRLRMEKPLWPRPTEPRFRLDVRNNNSTSVSFPENFWNDAGYVVLDGARVDAQSAKPQPEPLPGSLVDLKPGETLRDIEVSWLLWTVYNKVPAPEYIKARNSGKHTLRWTIPLAGGSVVVSNAAEYEVSENTWVPAVAIPAPGNPALQVYESKTVGFRFAIPADWKITDHGSKTGSMLVSPSFTLWVNNRRPGLAIKTTTVDSSSGTDRTVPVPIASQLEPGEISLYVISPERFRGFNTLSLDDMGPNLREALKAAPEKQDGDIFRKNIFFVKHGTPFNVGYYMRGPVADADRRRLEALLDSFTFLDAPVATEFWALQLAYQQLPDNIRKAAKALGGWGENWRRMDGTSDQSTNVEPTADGYLVTFKLGPSQQWQYAVSTNGKVTEITASAAKPADAPPATAQN